MLALVLAVVPWRVAWPSWKLVGKFLVASAPRMFLGSATALFRCIVLATSVGMALVPWRLHQRFDAAVVPHVFKRLRAVGLVAATQP